MGKRPVVNGVIRRNKMPGGRYRGKNGRAPRRGVGTKRRR